MVVVATVLFAATMAFAPEYGLIAKATRRARIRRHILEEDILKTLASLGRSAATAVQQRLGHKADIGQVQAALDALSTRGFVLKAGGAFALTEAGQRQANVLVRSHRLWEAYLTEHQMAEDDVHPTAERLEHAHDLAEEIADELGHPDVDPHGQPIPPPTE
jgi:Mn-dependent DtxR family transcriptional regulator